MSKKKNQNDSDNKIDVDSINRRLNSLIRVILEINFAKGKKLSLTSVVKALKSSGLDRKEIAEILGKKPSDIDPLLYSKSDKTQTEADTDE